MDTLENKKIAVLVTDGFEEVEMTKPIEALEKEGAQVSIVAPEQKVKAWNHTNWGKEYEAAVMLKDADPEAFDALVLPGGVMNPDKLRVNTLAVNFVRHFTQHGKPIASLCHGPWTLIETDYVKGKKVTSWPSLKTDLINAGAEWIDAAVVQDGVLVTSRKPDDIPKFNEAMIALFASMPESVKANE